MSTGPGSSIPLRPTGAIPTPRHRLAAATPHRIVGATPDSWIWLPSKLSYWHNDSYGICVTAEEAFAKACCGILISDAEAKRWAQSHGVLNGAALDEVLDWMASKGFEQDGNVYNDGHKASVDYTNEVVMRNAIATGPVKLGVASGQLHRAVGSRNGWFGLNFRHDGSEDHSTTACGYGTIAWLATQLGVTVPSGVDGTKSGYAMFTWSTIGILDVASLVAITGEAWIRQPTTLTTGTNPPTPDPVFTPPVATLPPISWNVG